MMINVGATLHAFVERKLLPQHLMMVSEGENVNTRWGEGEFFWKRQKKKKHNTRTRACERVSRACHSAHAQVRGVRGERNC